MCLLILHLSITIQIMGNIQHFLSQKPKIPGYQFVFSLFLNQARAWFLKIDPVRIVGMHACVRVCVCVSAPEAINN